MYVLIRDTQRPRHYFTYDERGLPTWTTSRLDAGRFSSREEATEYRRSLNLGNSRIVNVGHDGEAVIHNNVELEIFRRGKSWRIRVGIFDFQKADYEYIYGRKSVATPQEAFNYGRRFIDSVLTKA